MNRLAPLWLGLVFLFLAADSAQAQWVVAFQDKTKRELNAVFFLIRALSFSRHILTVWRKTYACTTTTISSHLTNCAMVRYRER